LRVRLLGVRPSGLTPKFLKMNIKFLIIFFLIANTFAQDCSRIVSLAPSLTDSLLYLGIKPVGVTKFCNAPEIEKIGGFLDPSVEKILTLNPTLVVGLNEHKTLISQLESLGLKTATFEHRNIDGINQSLKRLSRVCLGKEEIKFEDELSKINSDLSGTAIVVVSRDNLNLKDVVLSGNDGFYTELLERLGVKNLFSDYRTELVSMEYLYSISPDFVLEISDYDASLWKNLYPDAKVTRVPPSLGGVPGPKVLDLAKFLVKEWQ